VDSTCGTIFLGTPFKGSDTAIWGILAEKFLGLFGDSNEQTIMDLDKRSKKLQLINDEFHKVLKRRYNSKELNPIQVACFFETVSTTKTFWKTKKDLGLIVTKQSATLAGDDGMPINSDHCAMCRFANAQATGYVDITDTIKLMIENWGKKTADREVRNLQWRPFTLTNVSRITEGSTSALEM
jgi:protein SERAC1